ncbi:MAG TPA: hypothetical protein VKA63_07520 [Candidatus Krumholzibacteria bacterium]|nr:hypothetical protein [Candidatus Krumholzibacteria bacterium]
MQMNRRRMSGILAVLLIISLAWVGCSNDSSNLTGPQNQNQAELSQLYGRANPAMQSAMDIQLKNTPVLMATDRVVGTATGVDDNGAPVLLVLTETAVPSTTFPARIQGLKVKQMVVGHLVAMKGPPGGGGGGGGHGGGGVSHTAIQTPPIELGTSGGWSYDLANGYCCGGTLGSLIQIGGSQYVLSNWHVLEADIVSGGNNRTAQNGDPVIQPGLIDVNCSASSAQAVATLSLKHSLPNNNVDCAVAQVIPGMVKSDGSILEIGTLSSQTVAAFVGQAVKKSGRTTGLARSTISGLNASVSISYENECAGGSAFTKTFTGQIVIDNKHSGFLDSGDSGSLMVEDVSSNPRAVGLLYAGSRTAAIANPIDDVLSFLNATMVGN